MLPLNTCLLFACALEQTFTEREKRVFLVVCMVLLSWVCSIQAVSFHKQLLALRDFPSADQGVDSQWKALCTWVRNNTPQNAVIVSPPVEFTNFTWLAKRATVAKFKLLPQTKAEVLVWYKRLGNLSGDVSVWTTMKSKNLNRPEIEEILTNGYNNLKTSQAEKLMAKYRADYFVNRIGHQLNLPIAYQNSLYTLYGKR